MKQEIIDLVKYRLEKAKNTLSDAKIYIDRASLNSTVNRIYYAMFYAVNALLLTKGLSSSKHSGIRALLNREFVNKGLLDKDWGRFYSDMFDNRQEDDYKDFVKFEKKDVKEWLELAEDFIGNTEGLILKIIEE